MVEQGDELQVERRGAGELFAQGGVDVGELVGEGAARAAGGRGGDVAAGREHVAEGGDLVEGDAAAQAGDVDVLGFGPVPGDRVAAPGMIMIDDAGDLLGE